MPKREPRPKAERGQAVAEYDPRDPAARMMAAVHTLRNNVIEVEKAAKAADRRDILLDFDPIRTNLAALRGKLLDEYLKRKKKAATDGQ